VAEAPGEKISAYRDKFIPPKIPPSQHVIAALDSVKVLPDIHVLLDPPLSLLQTTREARVLNETGSKDIKSILQERRRGDQIRECATDLTMRVNGQSVTPSNDYLIAPVSS
jgi:hypothetical protein